MEALTRVLVGIAWDSAHAAPVGVTFPQVRLLLMLAALGRVASARLAEALGVNASSVTRLSDKLAAGGYLVRGTDPANRSVVTLEVTAAGQQVVTHVLHRRHTAIGTLLHHLTPHQRRAAAAAATDLVAVAAQQSLAGSTGPGPL